MTTELMEAGKGEHHCYWINTETPDGEVLSPETHYLGIDAVCWYINKEPSWFKKRMASGTITISLEADSEDYNVSLGAFALAEHTQIAPVFDNPVLPDRNFRGGSIQIKTNLSGLANDTIFCKILKSSSSASLDIVSGMVSTATLNGPSKLLGAAGQKIISGIQDIFNTEGSQSEPFFDALTGIVMNIKPEDITSAERYLLFHRGSELDESKLTINKSSKLIAPYLDDNILTDGAWLLLRIRRSIQYSGYREWFTNEKAIRLQTENLVNNFFAGIVTKEQALSEFKLTSAGDKTIMDNYRKLQVIIGNDGVISENEAKMRTKKLMTRLTAARESITNEKPCYEEIIKDTFHKISIGKKPTGEIGKILSENLGSISKIREESLAHLPPTILATRSQKMMAQDIYMKKAFSESLEHEINLAEL